MPMNSSQRAEHVKKLDSAPAQTNNTRALGVAKQLPRMAREVRRMLTQFDNRFQNIPGANLAAKQTAFFAEISAETDGDLILHDFGVMLDSLLTIANDYRQPDEDAIVATFTDADVTAYLP